MNYATRVRKGIRRLERAKDAAERRGNAILGGILKELNKGDPGWVLRPCGQDEVIFFMNGNECVSANLQSGEIDALCILTGVGRRGMKVLADEVAKKKDAWLNVTNDFQKQRVLLLEKDREIKLARVRGLA